MYYTVFKYHDSQHAIIHREAASPYAEDLATYKDYFTVEQKPTLQEAEIIFRICKPGTLCAGIKSATTIKLK